MKLVFVITIVIVLKACSFDNKSGIWKNDEGSVIESKIFRDFQDLLSIDKNFDQIKKIDKNFKFQILKEIKSISWNDIFYNSNNNIKNFDYTNSNFLTFRSKKISNSVSSDYLLSDGENIFLSDEKGNIIIFSVKDNQILKKFNFYKKRFKKIKKKLNLILNEDILYISDNIGYLYSYDYRKDKIIWAKNYKIPFRSNLKISKNKLIAANQNNNLFFFNKQNGNIIKMIPTEESKVKNDFINNLAVQENITIFLNTYGSLYAINNKTLRINWFQNLNETQDINLSNLFLGSYVMIIDNKVISPSKNFLHIFDIETGSLLFKEKFSTELSPIATNENIFLILDNDLLVCLNLNNGNIIYSYDLNQKIADFLRTKKKTATFKDLKILNSKLFIFLQNSYVIQLDLKGEIEEIKKLPSKIKTKPIILNNSIMYLDNKNKLSIIN